MPESKQYAPSTIAAQALHFTDSTTGGVVPPIHPSTTFVRDENYELVGKYGYSREQNPTYDQVEAVLAHLEGGAEAQVYASGLAAAGAVFETVNAGQHIVAPDMMYYGLKEWLVRISEKRSIGLDFVDMTRPDAVREKICPGATALVWVEPIANPTWEVTDLAAIAEIAHKDNALLAADCTCTPPVTTKALEQGADLVFHSTTKYLNGHSDAVGGALITCEANSVWEEIKHLRHKLGAVPGPFEAWLLLRGLRTLSIRYERASENALRIARHFEGHPKVESVLYPGLESHPGHAIACKQMTGGFGGMLSLCVTGGKDEALRFVTGLRLILLATSLGGVESLAEHRKTIEGPDSLVPENLVRFSIGIESADDLIDDLEHALQRI